MRGYVAHIRSVGARQGDRLRRHAMAGWGLWLTWARSLYLPDEVNLYMDSFIRAVFSLYYLPSIVVVLAVTHSALERVVWVLVVPVTQEMERNPYRFSSLQTLSAGLSSIAIKIAPFAALGISFATVGHKATNCFGEAMLDAYTTRSDKDYPLLLARLQFVLEKRSRIFTFCAVMVVLGITLVYVFQQQTIDFLSRDEPHVLIAVSVVAVTQGLFIVVTVLRGAPEDVKEVITGKLSSAAEMLTSLGSPKKRASRAAWSDGGSNSSSESSSPMGPRGAKGWGSFKGAGAGGGGGGEYGEHPLSDSVGLPRDGADRRHPDARSQPLMPQRPQQQRTEDGAGSPLGAAFDPPDVTTSAVRFVSYFLGDWWTHNIHYMRHIGFSMAAVFGVWVAASDGLIQGATSAVLLIMCLNFPHLFGYVSLMVTFAAIRTLRSLGWLLRHRDMLLPVLVVGMPYQIVLLNALHYFRHHPATCGLLLAVNVLLVARAIDLVREFDVSEHGSVHWEDAHKECVSSRLASPNVPEGSQKPIPGGGAPSGAGEVHPRGAPKNRNGDATTAGGLVKPSLATLLEDAFEKHHKRPGLVSLDMAIDIKHMRIQYADKKKPDVALARHQMVAYGAGRRYLRDRNFYAYVLPRLLSLQSPGYFAGAQYRMARVILRAITITALFLFTLIVFGMILQAAFPQLRSLPVRVTGPADHSFLTVDHVVVRMNLLSAKATAASAGGGEDAKTEMPQDGAVPDAAHAVFQWSNVTSAAGDDFYPRLCRRDYYGTSVWELSLLALAPYLFNADEVGMLVDFMNAHLDSDWVVRPRHGASCVATDSAHTPTRWSGFYDFYSAKRDTSVVALRGTDLFSFADFLIDINLFFESVLYQVMTFIVPGAIVVPKELVVNLIRMVSLRGGDEPEEDVGNLDGVFGAARERGTWAALVRSTNTSLRRCQQNNYRRDFFADVVNHLTFVATHRDDRDGRVRVPPQHVVLTGHSLGGAVAAIVGARMDVDVVSFSAPGIALARKKFNVDLRWVHKRVMTVISSNDIVPAVGEQAGELHHVECLAVRRELCHAMEFMVGTLWRSCSSVREKFPALAQIV